MLVFKTLGEDCYHIYYRSSVPGGWETQKNILLPLQVTCF